MLECISFKSLTPSASPSLPNLPPPPPSQGKNNSTEENTPATSRGSSPAPNNVTREYDLAVQANSYNEIRSKIQYPVQDQVHLIDGHAEEEDEEHSHRQVLSQVLLPGRESVQEALQNAKPSTLTRLVSTYFDHSENTCNLCLLLHRSVLRARAMYTPLFDLINLLPTDSTSSSSFSQHHCNLAFDLFVEFDLQQNPFPSPDSQNFFNMRSSFSELKNELDLRRRKCNSRIRLLRRAPAGCALCLFVTAVGVVVSTVVVTTHFVSGLAAVAAAPFCTSYVPRPKATEKKERARLKQLDAASKGTLVKHYLETVDSLVDRLHTAVEGDMVLVRFALERGRDRHPIQEVLKQLRKNQQSFLDLLEDLEQHIFLCFNIVNKARSSLLHEICLHQTL